MDEQDRLGEFIRSRLSEMDQTGQTDKWDVPDTKVWASAQQQLKSAPSKAWFSQGSTVLNSTLLVLLCIAGIMLIRLNNRVHTLEGRLTEIEQQDSLEENTRDDSRITDSVFSKRMQSGSSMQEAAQDGRSEGLHASSLKETRTTETLNQQSTYRSTHQDQVLSQNPSENSRLNLPELLSQTDRADISVDPVGLERPPLEPDNPDRPSQDQWSDPRAGTLADSQSFPAARGTRSQLGGIARPESGSITEPGELRQAGNQTNPTPTSQTRAYVLPAAQPVPIIRTAALPSSTGLRLDDERTFVPIVPGKPRRSFSHEFEAAYLFSVLRRPITQAREIPDQEIRAGREAIKASYTPLHGIGMGYSWDGRWWIRSGFSYGSSPYNSENSIALTYDPSRQVELPSGDYEYTFSIESLTPFSESSSEISILIGEEDRLESGEDLGLRLSESLRIREWQIPLLLEYRRAEEMIGWFVFGGGQYEQITARDYDLEASLETERLDLLVDRISSVSESRSTRFFTARAGLGITIQPGARWNTRASMEYNYSFFPQSNIDFGQAGKSAVMWQLGIGYSFNR